NRSRSNFPDFRSADRRRLFKNLFDNEVFTDPEMFYDTTPRSGWSDSWHRPSFFNDDDDDKWKSRKFPTRHTSFAAPHGGFSKSTAGHRSGFDDHGIPVHVMRDSSPDKKSWYKQKERHNSTGSSGATSSSAGSNESGGHTTHKPRVVNIPIHVEPRDEEHYAVHSSQSPSRRVSAGKSRREVSPPHPLSRSGSCASEPARDNPRYVIPQGPRAHSLPVDEPLRRRVSPERKRVSPERSRVSRTQSMSHKPEPHRVYSVPIRVENSSYGTLPRRSPPETVPEELNLSPPRHTGQHDDEAQRYTSSAHIDVKAPQSPAQQHPDEHVTRIPVNIEPSTPNRSDYPNISANLVKQAVRQRAAQKAREMEMAAENDQEMPDTESNVSHKQPDAEDAKQPDEKPAAEQESSQATTKRRAPSPPKPKSSLEKIEGIQAAVNDLKGKIEEFSGSVYDKNYLYLDEQLTQNMLKLDVIDTEGKDEVRKARKSTVQEIQRCLAKLEVKVKKTIALQSGVNESNEEGYYSMETEQGSNY
ncbi:Uncharacterised protein PB.5945, partial [Pycnogonum litorale]